MIKIKKDQKKEEAAQPQTLKQDKMFRVEIQNGKKHGRNALIR